MNTHNGCIRSVGRDVIAVPTSSVTFKKIYNIFSKIESLYVLNDIAICKNITYQFSTWKVGVILCSTKTLEIGLVKVLSCLKKKTLIKLYQSFDPCDTLSLKNEIVLNLSTNILLMGISNFFHDCKKSTLIECCKRLDDIDDLDLSQITKKEYISALGDNIFSFGMGNVLSSLSYVTLRNICNECNLIIESKSKEVIMDCIMEQKNYFRMKK